MSSAFNRLARTIGWQASGKTRRKPLRRSPLRNALQVECLEHRHLMSVVPVGLETRAHPLITTPQVTWPESPQAVAMNASGNAVIVFSSPNTQPTNDDGVTQTGVWFRRVPPNGNISTTSPVEVNVTKNGPQAFGSVAMAPDGSFVIVWSGNGVNTGGRPTDLPAQGALDGSGIFFRRYDAAGNPRDAGERMANTTVPTGVGQDAVQEHPTVAMDADGNFVVVWTVSETSGSLNSQRNVFMRRYTQGGVPIDLTEVQVNTSTTQVEKLATVAMNADGDMVILWSSASTVNGDFELLGRYMRSEDGQFGPVFNAVTGVLNDQYASVGLDNAGDFVITYTVGSLVTENPNNLNGDAEVFFRRFTAPLGVAAAPVAKDAGDRFMTVTNTAIPGVQRFSRVGVVPETGDFTIVWDGLGPATVDFNGDAVAEETIATGGGVFGQRFLANGTQVGNLFRVNTSLAGPQRLSGIGVRLQEGLAPENHSIFVAWSGNGTQNLTGQEDSQGVFYQRYQRQTPDVAFTLPGPNPVQYSVRTPTQRILDAQATVTAPAGISYAGIRLAVVLSTQGTGANALDPALETLGIFDEGPGVDTVDVNGANIFFNNIQIGAFTFQADPNDLLKLQLVVTFNAQATTAGVQAVLQNVFYQHAQPPLSPLLPDRFTTWFFTDAANLTTNTLSKTIRFTDETSGGGGSRFRNRGFCTVCGIPAQNYAASLYRVVLEREGSTAEVTALSNALRNGYPPANAVAGFVNSVEYRRWLIADPVNGFYFRFLGRQADEGGVQFWLNAMAHGVSEPQVLAGITGSSEFFTTQGGGTNAGFVNALYTKVLNRAASAAEVNFYVSRLNAGVGRADIANGFIQSQEYRTILVREWYDHYLAINPVDNFRLNQALSRFGSSGNWRAVQTFILTSLDAIPRPLQLGS